MLLVVIPLFMASVASPSQGHPAARPSMVTFGDCYDIVTPADFNFTTFSAGKWYEISRYDNDFESTADCVEQALFLDDTKNSLTINYSLRLKNGSHAIQQAALNYNVTNTEILLQVSYPDETTMANFDILKTDFTSYAITYSCRQITTEGLPMKDERLWVLSRSTNLSPEAAAAVEEGLIYNGDSLGAYLYETNQDNCL